MDTPQNTDVQAAFELLNNTLDEERTRIFKADSQAMDRQDVKLAQGVLDFAQHFMVTVYRPVFDEHGNRIATIVPEVGQKATEVGQKATEVGRKATEVGRKPDFEMIMKNYRRDFRLTYSNVWACLATDATLPRKAIAAQLKIAESSVQSATNALLEVGLLVREGRGRGRIWIVKTIPERESDK